MANILSSGFPLRPLNSIAPLAVPGPAAENGFPGGPGPKLKKTMFLQRVALCFRAFSDEQEGRFGNWLSPWAALPQDFFPQWLSSHTVFQGRTVQAPTETWVMDIIFLEQLSPTL